MTARRFLPAVAAVALWAATPAAAQDPSPSPDQPEASTRTAVPRAGRARSERADGEARTVRSPRRVDADASDAQETRRRVRAPEPAPAPPVAAAPVVANAEEQGGRRRPGAGSASGGGRSGGGEVRSRSGGVRRPDAGDSDGGRNWDGRRAQAVPRSQAPRPPRTIIVSPNYYGRRHFYGPAGFGYWAYDPWSWYGYGWPGYGWSGYYGNVGYYGSGWGGGWGGYGTYAGPHGWSIGGVRLKVEPKDAEVYVDGYYAGIVDDFDGIWQQLRLDDGGHRIEVRKPGLNTLTFDVMVQPGRTITYRGDMRVTP